MPCLSAIVACSNDTAVFHYDCADRNLANLTSLLRFLQRKAHKKFVFGSHKGTYLIRKKSREINFHYIRNHPVPGAPWRFRHLHSVGRSSRVS